MNTTLQAFMDKNNLVWIEENCPWLPTQPIDLEEDAEGQSIRILNPRHINPNCKAPQPKAMEFDKDGKCIGSYPEPAQWFKFKD
jgi:hypothetical protein